MTRKSKIARLPRSIRDELNHRLDNGHTGVRLVEWLNSLPEVKEVLAREFQGRRITPQNISEWKRGGYQDWLAQQEHAATLQDFLADAKELGEAASPEKLTEAIFNFALVHYAAAMQRSAYRPEHSESLNRCSQMLNDVIRLRNCDLAQQRFDLDTQKLAFNAEKLGMQTELARLRLDLDRARLELARQKVGAAMNPEGVPATSPGLRRDTGRYPREPSPEIVPNPERVVSRKAQDLITVLPSALKRNTQHATRNTDQPPSSPSSESPINPSETAKTPLEINPLQPNSTKSNHPFFIFPQTTTVGRSFCLSPSTSFPQSLNPGITEHSSHFTRRNTQHATRNTNLEP